ncbi:MAG: hypothetical protein LBI72_05365 [Flavobacteriaceae bacterium]|jgi:hypothetical protein|nr:hypothetical protein [Flavobacteriaceae bacterium]
MNSKIIFIFLCCTTLACNYPELGKTTLDLENFDTNFNIKKFYQGDIDRHRAYLKQKEELLDQGVTDFQNIEFPEFNIIEIEKQYVTDPKTNEDILFTSRYKMKSWKPTDSLASYGPLSFSKINMIESDKKDFMGLVASNDYAEESKANQLIQYITQKQGQPKHVKPLFYDQDRIYVWNTPNYTLAFSKEHNTNISERLKTYLSKGNPDKSYIKAKLYLIANQYVDTLKNNIAGEGWANMHIYYRNKR